MGEFNIAALLQKFSGEIVIASAIATALSLIVKKLFKLPTKLLIAVSLFLGGLCYAAIDRLFINSEGGIMLTNALTGGALSVTLTLFVKQLAFSDSGDIKKSLEKLLSSIVLSEQLDEVVDNILEKLSQSSDATADNLKEIIQDNLDAELDETELSDIVSFIINACDLGKKKDGE